MSSTPSAATNDLSNLTTLAALTKSAEARTPKPAPAVLTAGSGLIDIHAMETAARQASSAPPKPMVLPPRLPSQASSRTATTDPEILIAIEAKRRRKRFVFGVVVAGAAVVAIAFTIAFAGPSKEAKSAAVAVAETMPPTVAAPAPAPVPPPPVAATPPVVSTPAPVAAAAPSPPTAKGHAAKGRHPVKPGKGGPKLTKVNAAGNISH